MPDTSTTTTTPNNGQQTPQTVAKEATCSTTENESSCKKSSSSSNSSSVDTSKISELYQYESEIYINEEFAKVEDPFETVQFDNGESYKITIFFAPKFMFDPNTNYFTSDNYTFLKYNETVKAISIEDKLARFGIKGYIDVVNTGEHLNFILDRLNCYYLVINFTLVANEKQGIKFEPYILDVVSTTNQIDNSGDNKQILRLHFVDELSYITMQHSMATLIKYKGGIATSKSYREVFKMILSYLKEFVSLNYNNIYGLKKDCMFDEDYDTNNKGTTVSADVSRLIACSFKKMDPSCTIYEGLDILLRDCCAPMVSTDKFKSSFNDFEYMLIPVFFKEEYGDMCGIYKRAFDKNYKDVNTNTKSSSSTKLTDTLKKIVQNSAKVLSGIVGITSSISQIITGKSIDNDFSILQLMNNSQMKGTKQLIIKNFNGTDDILVMRNMSLRDIHMPFKLCFTKDCNAIFESINPSMNENGCYTTDEKKWFPMNGRKELGINNYYYFPTNQQLVQKLWKNMVITNVSAKTNSVSSVLIEFNWIYQYFTYNFLGKGSGNNGEYISNITPSFYLARNSISEKNKSDFNEYNSNFAVIRSDSDLDEALLYIGKNLCSFVTQNDTYMFTVRGDLFRHPNEIIKVSQNKNDTKNNPGIAINTDIMMNDYILMYITSVTHTWSGTKFHDTMYCNKVYERLKNDTVEKI